MRMYSIALWNPPDACLPLGKGHIVAASSALWMWRTQLTVTFASGGR